MKLRACPWIVVLALALLAALLAAEARQAGKVYRIGILPPGPLSTRLHLWEAFRKGLRELGHVEGQSISLEFPAQEVQPERLSDLAAELVRRNVDLIVTATNPGIIAAKRATSTIPIVMVVAADPVGADLVASLARPGGNVTGLTFDVSPEIAAKRLELLKEVTPRVSNVAVLWNSSYPPNAARWAATEDAARKLKVTLLSAEVRQPDELESAFVTMIRGRAAAFVVLPDPFVAFPRRAQIAELAAKNRLPAMYPFREAAEADGLMAYGADVGDMYRRAATFVDKILKGAKPADLPVEQPTKFELVINLKTAKALGLTIPPSLLLRADHVIE